MTRQMKVIKAAIFGTSFMTLFSYAFSLLSKDNAREPELLGKLVRRLRPGMSKKDAKVAGWAAHYGIGLLFAELYGQIWQRTAVNADAESGLVFGGLSGIAAILVWKFTLAAHPFPPPVNFGAFALNLFLAHLIFGLFAAIGYKDDLTLGLSRRKYRERRGCRTSPMAEGGKKSGRNGYPS